ncbi:Ig-like domain-containing protein [Terriglobus roseus]|uniref:Ig-like domain-containing protein n=1 Tax=Terriglobus roseus TaxID=392734 RepID=UPI00094318D5|nr:Ig-like domain-containing protein [Terriglobus roseus]
MTNQWNQDGSATIHVGLPKSTQSDAIRFVLNGKNVAERFVRSGCNQNICEDATLTANDGLRTTKNLLAVIAEGGVSARLRFDGAMNTRSTVVLTGHSAGISATGLQAPQAATATATALLPTVTMRTAYTGGWNGAIDAAHPWLIVGSQYFPNVQPSGCGGSGVPSSRYLVIVLDRQTLTEKTNAPQSSPQCFNDAVSLKTYLGTLDSSDLAIAGTTFQHDADANVDFTPIGGSAWTGQPGTTGYPAGMLAIGAGGAARGSAYEGYYTHDPGNQAVLPFAYGTVQEDAYGNYNFQSSEVVEYTVSPNDPGFLTPSKTSAINVSVPTQFPSGNPNITSYTYTPPAGTNGYWLLSLSRYSLNTYPYACAQTGTSTDGHVQYVVQCGTFYPTGSSDPATSDAAYTQLATDLGSINAWQLAFLTTVGQAAYGGSNNSWWNVAGWQGYNQAMNGFAKFSAALDALNGTSRLTQSLLSPASAYTFVTSKGAGGPLNGSAIESTTVLSAQGQTGLIHGILQRNLNGLFLPQQTNQETADTFTLKGGINSPEFKLTEVAMAQPVDWPSTNLTTQLPGTDSISGQLGAYKYFSYVLLKNVYLPSLTGSHLDDLHYFFPSSLNTSINYHYYDPNVILWPGGNPIGPYVLPCSSVNGNTCTVNLLANETVSFTENDFLAMRQQLSTEIHDLTDTLQYMITGSTNMKDIISGGNSNVGLALTGAASTILGSKLVPVPPTTKVTTSWQSIVSMIGGVASLASAIPGLGEVAGIAQLGTDAAKIFGGSSSAIGGVLGMASGAGGITSSTTSSVLPSSFSKFATTVGQLANGSMQSQLSVGFDTMTDSIVSDWGRISTIGPMVMDTNNTTFFAPNQVQQSVAVAALTQAASRNFYLALMPSFYYVHAWRGVWGDSTTPANNIPDMGYLYNSDIPVEYYCNAYYLDPQQNSGTSMAGLGTITPYASVYYPALLGIGQYFGNDRSSTPIDYYVLAGATTGGGSDDPRIQVIDPTLAANLFSTSGLNLPLDEFVHVNGPMAGSTTWIDASTNNPASHQARTTCASHLYEADVSNPEENSSVSATPPLGIITTTTLSVPSSIVAGTGAVLTATITANNARLNVGSVYFLDKGVILSTVPVDNTGTATVTWPSLALGSHALQAKYIANGNYNTSSSSIATVGVYSAAPDLSLSIGAGSLSVPVGHSSSVGIQMTSLYGLSGMVSLSCTGLPANVTCVFNPKTVQILSNGIATSALTLTRAAAIPAGLPLGVNRWTLLLMPISLGLLWSIRRRRSALRGVVLVLLIMLGIGSTTGCSGSSSNTTTQPTEPQTILVSATVGSMSKTIPLVLSLQ